jgi:hypothetical protein
VLVMGRRPKAKKRGSPGGEQHPNAKLTWDDVRRIRELRLWSDWSYDDIAEAFDVSYNTIRDICLNMTWIAPGMKKIPYRQKTNKGFGEQHHKAKLTVEKVREIRRRFDSGEYKSVRSLAIEFGINRTNCKEICHRQAWKHVV